MCYEDRVKELFGDVLNFPSLEKLNKSDLKNPEILSEIEISEITDKATNDAQSRAASF